MVERMSDDSIAQLTAQIREFRDAYPVSRHPDFTRFREDHAWIPSFAQTSPNAG